jgi:hypothetical protein
MPRERRDSRIRLAMYARAVDDAAARLRKLRHDEWGNLGLALMSLGSAIAATQLRPALAGPLFIGGLVVGAAGLAALWNHWDLVDRLAIDRNAYVISEVRAYASREATIPRRRMYAARLRSRLQRPGFRLEARVTATAEEL